jgi:hypothetical protein
MEITARFTTPFGISDFEILACRTNRGGFAPHFQKPSTQICPTLFSRNSPEQQTIKIYLQAEIN